MPPNQNVISRIITRNRSLLIITILLLLFYLFAMFPQDARLLRLRSAFGKTQHPPGTRLVRAHSFVGVMDLGRRMYADSFPQGCDYMVGELREYTGAKETLQAFYAAHPLLVDGQAQPISVIFPSVNAGGVPDAVAATRDDLKQWGPGGVALVDFLYQEHSPWLLQKSDLRPGDLYYFAYLWRQELGHGFSPSSLDVRCH